MLTDSDLLNASILIVDDQIAHVQLLERMLGDAGYLNISSTTDPQRVCALHRRHHYDLILLDLQMPGLDGFGVMAELQADAGERVLPVIALTAQPGHKLRALQGGARDFISKPFDMVEVKIRIHHMLEVRLLYKILEAQNDALERTVLQRTAALQVSEARFRSLTELAADWFWELNAAGEVTATSGQALELLSHNHHQANGHPAAANSSAGWDSAGLLELQKNIAARQPFLDLHINQVRADGAFQQYRISGEPIFDRSCRIIGYRGVGTAVLPVGPAA
jgi:DNA-binding response OmpR family regulator